MQQTALSAVGVVVPVAFAAIADAEAALARVNRPTQPLARLVGYRPASTAPAGKLVPAAIENARLFEETREAEELARTTYRRMKNQAVAADPQAGGAERRDPRTTSVIAGTRLDLLEAMEELEREHPQMVEPLLLRDVYGLPYDEIAALVDAPLGTVKAQIHHGRKLARPLLRGER